MKVGLTNKKQLPHKDHISSGESISVFTLSLSYLLSEADQINHSELIAVITSAINKLQDIDDSVDAHREIEKRRDIILALKIIKNCKNLDQKQLDCLIAKMGDEVSNIGKIN